MSFKNRNNFSPVKNEGPRINDQIRLPRIILIDHNGVNHGEYKTFKAKEIAIENGLDLVEVDAKSRLPVCKIMDYGKHKYEQSVKSKKSNKTNTSLKEVRFRTNTGQADLDFKLERVKKWLQAGHNVSIRLEFKNRENAHKDLGLKNVQEFVEKCAEWGKVIQNPKIDGRYVHSMIESISNK